MLFPLFDLNHVLILIISEVSNYTDIAVILWRESVTNQVNGMKAKITTGRNILKK